MKIIVVDDEMSALHAFLNEIIEEQGVEYKFYRDDIAAVCKYTAENAVDAAFLDINMPKMNGIELAEKLIKISPALKLVFITGLSVTESDLPENVRQHTAGFLYKPYDMSRLLMLMSLIKDKRRVLKAEMFDTFDCFVDGNKVNFSSSKSKEAVCPAARIQREDSDHGRRHRSSVAGRRGGQKQDTVPRRGMATEKDTGRHRDRLR